MTKAELESKHLSDLHALAAKAGVERYRMLSRTELIAKLSNGDSGGGDREPRQQRKPGGRRERPSRESRPQRPSGEGGDRPPRRRRRRPAGGDALADEALGGRSQKPAEEPPAPEPPRATPSPSAAEPAGSGRPKRRRRRRRFGRRGKDEVALQDLLLPPVAGRQAVLCAESAAACTALLRGVASDLAADSKGPDPVVLLIDPSPEELAEWKREAPQAEIVAAGQARHASDALAQAAARAGGGDDVILLVDSLTRLAAAYGDADSAKEFFDAGRVQGTAGGGSLTVVVALERS